MNTENGEGSLSGPLDMRMHLIRAVESFADAENKGIWLKGNVRYNTLTEAVNFLFDVVPDQPERFPWMLGVILRNRSELNAVSELASTVLQLTEATDGAPDPECVEHPLFGHLQPLAEHARRLLLEGDGAA